MPMDQKMLSSAIESAQKRVESRNFQTRKTLLEYDDVMNTQREIIYQQRGQVLAGEDLTASISGMIDTTVETTVRGHLGELTSPDLSAFKAAIEPFVGSMFSPAEFRKLAETLPARSTEDLIAELQSLAHNRYASREAEYGSNVMREVERVIMLQVVDEYWMDQIDSMNELKHGIGLRAYGQADPLVEYKREGFDMFEQMVAAIQEETVRRLFTFRLRTNEEVQRQRVAKVTGEFGAGDLTLKKQPAKKTVKVGRNDPCPCGSGLKWKKCTCAEYHKDAQ